MQSELEKQAEPTDPSEQILRAQRRLAHCERDSQAEPTEPSEQVLLKQTAPLLAQYELFSQGDPIAPSVQ